MTDSEKARPVTADPNDVSGAAARRAFLAGAGKATAPAVALLLAASAVPDKANAQATSGATSEGTGNGTGTGTGGGGGGGGNPNDAGGALGALLVFGGAAAAWHGLRSASGRDAAPSADPTPEDRSGPAA